MQHPSSRLLGNGTRLHLQHGPIDLIIGLDAASGETRAQVFQSASRRFDTVLSELVEELPLLKSAGARAQPKGRVAQRMVQAIRPHEATIFVTPMAAVAGAVADEILETITQNAAPPRAYVNNGGDIALHLNKGTTYAALIAGLDGAVHGRIDIDAATPVRGIATSGRGGRSLSLGIADNVTVLASTAATADVAATLIANAVNLPDHAAISRSPAHDLDPDSDLGARLVTTDVGPLTPKDIARALEAGQQAAQTMVQSGLIEGAALFLRHTQRIVGRLPHNPTQYEVTRYA